MSMKRGSLKDSHSPASMGFLLGFEWSLESHVAVFEQFAYRVSI